MVEQQRLPGQYLAGWQLLHPAITARPRIAELRAEGRSWTSVAHRLNVEGVATPTGRGHWYPTTAQRHAHPERWAEYQRGYRARRTR